MSNSIRSSLNRGGRVCWTSGGYFYTGLVFILAMNLSEAHIKLNVPRVRLPYFDQLSVNFTLQVETPGCYTWTVTRPDIISITSAGEANSFDYDGTECASQVVISAAPRISPCCPASAIVYVEDRVTKEMVRCDVIIDKIVSLSIHTTTKELHMEEAPSEFYVEGHGNKGDTFSTMDGIPFRWWLESVGSDTTVEPQSIMRFMTFAESTYQAPPGVASLEAKRLQGSTILVEGLKTGSARVFAKLTDSIYKNVPPAEVRIVVVANLQVDPREAFVVPDTKLPLRLRQMRHGKLVEIALPSTTYSFEVVNTSVVSYDNKKSIITALNYGTTDIIVRDKNALATNVGDMIEHSEGLISRINVREPRFLALTVAPFRNWALRIGQEYAIEVDIYDEENQKIYVSDNIFVETTFDETYFKVFSSSANGTYHVGIPIKTGSAKVQARLKHLKKLDGTFVEPRTAIRVKADMEIFQSVVISPAEIILPWDPNLHPKHDIRYTASGGNGNFFWTSTNTSVVTVTQNGMARTETKGYANVTASMTINSNIKGSARVYILPPTDMKILDHNVEAEIGTSILVPLAFYAIRPNDASRTPVPYSRCHQLPFQVNVEDPIFSYDDKSYYPASKPACAFLPIIGSALGSSLVTVTYKVQDLVFQDSVVVSTFKPLTIIEPANQKTVLAIGSSRQIAFEGGPRPLVENHGFFRSVSVVNSTVAAAEEIKSNGAKEDMYVYTVLCKEIGETDVILELGNRPKQSSAARSVLRTAEVRVICAEPAKIYYKVESPIKAGGVKCPSEASATQVVRVAIPNYENTRVMVVVKDARGDRFDNITSLSIDWTATPGLVTLKHPESLTTDAVPLSFYFTVGHTYQTIQPNGKSGNLVLKAEITGYDKNVLAKAGLRKHFQLSVPVTDGEDVFDERNYSMDLQLVSDVIAYPSDISLFNHPTSKVNVRIDEGSGYFDYEIVGDAIINAEYFESNKTLQITPVVEGTAKIIIRDLCLTPRRPAEITVQVNGIGLIDVAVLTKIQLLQETNLTVTVYDKGGHLLPPHVLSRINLKLSPLDKSILHLSPLEPTSEDIRSSQRRYSVKGTGVGVVLVTFSADGPGRLVQSQPTRISVFPPLRVKPKNITLLVGSVYQLKAVGGPEDDSNINYRTRHSHEIASVSSNGIIQGRKLGKTVVGVEAVNRNTEDNIYSDDEVNVKVVSLKGVRIVAPLTRIQTGYEMPLHIIGIGDGLEQLPPTVLLGDKKPLLAIDWTNSNADVASLDHIFQNRGYTPDGGDQLSIRFKSKAAGTVIVKVFALFDGEHQHMDEIKIEVYDQLSLLNLPCGFVNYLMAPNSELRLQTNRDASAKVEFGLLTSNTVQCDDNSDKCRSDGTVLSLSKDGLVQSHGVTGQATIFIVVTEEFGVIHSTTVVIDVKPISYLTINPDLPISYTGRASGVLPRGVSFPLKITYHDSVGKKFDAVSAASKVRSNRFDLIHVKASSENHTYVASATHEGRVCIQVLDSQSDAVTDYLVTNVAESIEPKLPLGIVTMGDIMCFSCPIKSQNLRNGVWIATPSNVVTVDGDSGMVYARSPGFSRLEYTMPILGSVSAVDLNVIPIDKLKFEVGTAPGVEITNGDPNHVYDVFVRVGDKKSPMLGKNCSENFVQRVISPPFSCSLQFENVDIVGSYFAVSPVFNFEQHQYACRIKVLQTSAETLNLNYVHSNLVLMAKVNQDGGATGTIQYRRDIRTESLPILFHPALTLHVKELTLFGNDPYYEAELKLTGLSRLLEQIQIIPSDAAFIRIENQYSSSRLAAYLPQLSSSSSKQQQDVNSPETRTYSVFLQHDFCAKAELDEKFRMHVTIISPATRQQLTVPIKLKFHPHLTTVTYNKKTWTGWLSNLAVQINSMVLTPLLYVVVTVLIAHAVQRLVVTMKNKPRSEAAAVFATNPDQDMNMTPKRLLRDMQPRSGQGSPRTPMSTFGGGDHVHTPLLQNSNSPNRPRLFSTTFDGSGQYPGTPYVRKSAPFS